MEPIHINVREVALRVTIITEIIVIITVDTVDNVIIILVDVITSLTNHFIHMLVGSRVMQSVLIGIQRCQQILALKGNYFDKKKENFIFIFAENCLVFILLVSILNFTMIFLLMHHIWIIHLSIQCVFSIFCNEIFLFLFIV